MAGAAQSVVVSFVDADLPPRRDFFASPLPPPPLRYTSTYLARSNSPVRDSPSRTSVHLKIEPIKPFPNVPKDDLPTYGESRPLGVEMSGSLPHPPFRFPCSDQRSLAAAANFGASAVPRRPIYSPSSGWV